MEKIRCRCRTCVYEKEGQCKVKKVGVKVNKVRWCHAFVLSKEKVQALINKTTTKPKAVMRPDSYWTKKKQPYIGDVTDSDLFSVGSANSETHATVLADLGDSNMANPDCLAGLRKKLEVEEDEA